MEKETMPQNMNNGNKKKSDLLYFLIIIALLFSNIFFAYKFFNMRKEKVYVEVELKDTNVEKDKLQNELEIMLEEYDLLQTDNAKISEELEAEKEKIIEMLEEIKKIKSANAYQISQYKKELNTLREIMRSYIVQIDSLNTRNKILSEENIRVKTDYQTVKTEKDKISQRAEELSTKVDIAEVLRAMNIVAVGINDKGRENERFRRVDKLRICFTLAENAIAKPGPRWVYIRIARPDNIILPNPAGELFSHEGEQIVYTARREVDYQNKDIEMCIFWNDTGLLLPGAYKVDIFSEGRVIGKTTFALK